MRRDDDVGVLIYVILNELVESVQRPEVGFRLLWEETDIVLGRLDLERILLLLINYL